MSSSTVVLITGANSGIGYAASKIIASASSEYHVIMAGRSIDKVKTALSEIEESGSVRGKLSALQFEVTDEESIQKAAQKVEQEFARLDVLVNNAGIASREPSLKKNLEETLATNTIAPFVITEAFQSLLLKSKNPYLINVTSGLGSLQMVQDPKVPHAQESYMVYRMSKAALNMGTIVQGRELAKQGVKYFALCPGLVRSNLRGTGEESVSAGGRAISADTSGNFILEVIEGKRDTDSGKFIHAKGTYPW